MGNPSILVLDHDPLSLSTISKTLTKFNFKVLPFQTAGNALDSFKSGVAEDEELDLVLAEVHLGNMTVGTSVLFHYILNELQVPLITMCAYGDEEALSKCMTLGACFNVLKPLDPPTFNILVEKAMEHRCRRVKPEGSSILKKTKGVWEPDEYSKKLGQITWSTQLQEKFLQAVKSLGESATPGRILWHMDVKGVTSQQIATHLQKYRQKLKQEQDEHQDANMKLVADLITSACSATRTKSNNHRTTTQMKVTPGAAPAIRAQVEKSSVKPEVSNTKARSSVWDRYSKSLQDRKKSVCDRYQPTRFFMPYKQEFLPMPSKPITKYVGIENITPYAAGQMGFGTPVTSLLPQLNGNGYTEAAGNNGNMESFTLQEDNVNEVYTAATCAHDVVDVVSNGLLDGTGNNYSTAEKMPSASDPLCGSELETFWRSQLEGQEQQALGPDDLLQVEDVWNHALQSDSLDNATMAQESTIGDALMPMVQESAVGDAPVLQESTVGVVQESALGDALADDLLQVENAWNHALQSAGLVDATMVQESTVGDALIPMVQGSVVGDAPVLMVQESAAGVVQESAMGDAPADDLDLESSDDR
ncbi:uncharacterized protein LOC104581506 isoform X2 [Brachypodium distachyon]|uniref:uncharacterized protein LOC104581506 isoform X2 n=1 Tax=Brachypodium distachyon TaxID=15368 RepID=UPI00052FEDB6|nr:uncharacterized protein LOC104581506 isoform X2 [Brachypodium distachyon]|eukprot:XP_024312272.1 uncharacterized protein LOC104581506 isoform X2 [Brachypodium distachyon]